MVAVLGNQRGVGIPHTRVAVTSGQAIHVQSACEAHSGVNRFASIHNVALGRSKATIVVRVDHADVGLVGDADTQFGVKLPRVSGASKTERRQSYTIGRDLMFRTVTKHNQ